jgi:hypothetical protein
VSLRRIVTCWSLSGRDLLRRRIVLLLIFLIPALFFGLTILTTQNTVVLFKLAAAPGEPVVMVSERREALVFIGLAAAALIASFLGLNLAQRQVDATRRLVLCGFRSAEVSAAKGLLLLCVLTAIGVWVTGLLIPWFKPAHPSGLLAGYILTGFIYGAYGMLAGGLLKHELEGILCVVLLVNIDAGWLQNPIFYAEAQNRSVIRALPAYFPSQVAMLSAFSEYKIGIPLLKGILYGLILLSIAFFILHRKLRIYRHPDSQTDVS